MAGKSDAVGLKLDPCDGRLLELAAQTLDMSLSELVRRGALAYAAGVIPTRGSTQAQPPDQERDA